MKVVQVTEVLRWPTRWDRIRYGVMRALRFLSPWYDTEAAASKPETVADIVDDLLHHGRREDYSPPAPDEVLVAARMTIDADETDGLTWATTEKGLRLYPVYVGSDLKPVPQGKRRIDYLPEEVN